MSRLTNTPTATYTQGMGGKDSSKGSQGSIYAELESTVQLVAKHPPSIRADLCKTLPRHVSATLSRSRSDFEQGEHEMVCSIPLPVPSTGVQLQVSGISSNVPFFGRIYSKDLPTSLLNARTSTEILPEMTDGRQSAVTQNTRTASEELYWVCSVSLRASIELPMCPKVIR